ncbi:hypothetical protein [Saliphagus sp. LR7]|uniref:hypothetical protein n=1 Tax=Saliphagus sp. LR7 TaxID=2282654 RepID=UPI000DF834A9|nr:hypothetical protein [Saliphagus sp. LR7]
MHQLTKTSRRFLTARSVLILFGFQLILLLASILQAFVSSLNEGIVDGVLLLVVAHARLVNAGIDFLLFSPDYTGSLDLILGFLALPLVYYLTAIVVASSGRVAYQFGRKQLSL